MIPIGFFLGVAAFELAGRFKKPLRSAAVYTASHLISMTDSFKSTAYTIKEEVEDILAEAHYEKMKSNMTNINEQDEQVNLKAE